MLTVSSLLSDCGLELAAGSPDGDRGVRWVSISEHEDPTPWLSGGEVVLTTGYNLDTAAKQKAYVARIASTRSPLWASGPASTTRSVPDAILEAAKKHDMPLFEVPYEMPFIAITEAAAARLVSEQYDALARGSKVHEQLERLVIDGGGIDEITSSIAGAVGGSALVFDAALRQVARHPSKGSPGPRTWSRSPRRSRPAWIERCRRDVVRAGGAARPGSRGAGSGPPRRAAGGLAGRAVGARRAGRVRAASRSPSLDRRRARADARARRQRDGAPPCRRPPRGRAVGPPRPRGAGRATEAVRDRDGGSGPRLLARRPACCRARARDAPRSGGRPGPGGDRFDRVGVAPLRGDRAPAPTIRSRSRARPGSP